MKKLLAAAPVLVLMAFSSFGADHVIDLSGGCKVYKLENKKWVQTESPVMEGLGLEKSQILRDEKFTVFKTGDGTFGINQRCLKAGTPDSSSGEAPLTEEQPKPVGKRRAAAPILQRGDTHSPWAAVFAFGYNIAPNATVTTTFGGATTTDTSKYKSSLSFLGEANYRMSNSFRLAGELGLSQLQVDSVTGNETSFFDVRPELVFRSGKSFELYFGPMLGLFFLSQNTETRALSDGSHALVKQQTPSAFLIGFGAGADYILNAQFDVGFFLRYFKPGDLKITGTIVEIADTFSSTLSTSYTSAGFRFVIHF